MEKCFDEKFYKFKKGKVKTPKVEFFSLKILDLYKYVSRWFGIKYDVDDVKLSCWFRFDEFMAKRKGEPFLRNKFAS